MTIIVPLNSVTDVEYHVSRMNLFTLLSLGRVIIQMVKKRAFMRRPHDSHLVPRDPPNPCVILD